MAFRCTDGNASDAHIETWETLRAVAGRPDFLYVDSKLCSRENRRRKLLVALWRYSRPA